MKYQSFKEFYPYYLSQHQNIVCRMLHFFGTVFAVLCLLAFIFSFNLVYLFLAIILGYGFAWVGHAFFEKNAPATFKYPLYSLLGDLMMVRDILTGRIKIF